MQRHYVAAEFGALENEPLDSLHREKLGLLDGLVYEALLPTHERLQG